METSPKQTENKNNTTKIVEVVTRSTLWSHEEATTLITP